MTSKVLLLSRKDIHHPKAGGAELVMHEYAKGLVRKWYEVTQFSPRFDKPVSEEIIDGVKIIRLFSIHTIYFLFGFYYLFNLKWRYDIIIDHAWGIPFLSPLYIRNKPIYFIIHHVGDKERSEYFKQRIGLAFLWNIFWFLYTNFILGLYKNKITFTVSDGTANELKKLGFKKIIVIKNTTNRDIIEKPHLKNKELTIIGRIVPNKRIDHAIRVVSELKNHGHNYILNVVGNIQDETEYKNLQKLTKELWCEKNIRFMGKLEKDDIIEILDCTQYLLLTSKKEGFGITALEANTRAVPVIAYDIPWVNEAVHNGQNGILIADWKYTYIASYIMNKESDYNTLQKTTLAFINQYPKWNNNVDAMENILFSK